MKTPVRFALAILLLGSAAGTLPAYAQTIKILGNGIAIPSGVAVDASGNVFVADLGNDAVKEILAAGAYKTVHTLGSGNGFNQSSGVAVDASDNIFVTDDSGVQEMLAAGGYTTVNTLGAGFTGP